MIRPLKDHRVVTMGSGLALSLTRRLLSEQGAEVVRSPNCGESKAESSVRASEGFRSTEWMRDTAALKTADIIVVGNVGPSDVIRTVADALCDIAPNAVVTPVKAMSFQSGSGGALQSGSRAGP